MGWLTNSIFHNLRIFRILSKFRDFRSVLENNFLFIFDSKLQILITYESQFIGPFLEIYFPF